VRLISYSVNQSLNRIQTVDWLAFSLVDAARMLKQLHLGRELQFWQRPTTATNKEQIRYFCRTIHYEQKNADLDERSGNKI